MSCLPDRSRDELDRWNLGTRSFIGFSASSMVQQAYMMGIV
jgi:hypothetical protein